MSTRGASLAPPSAIARASVSLVLLLGFYLVVLGLAALFFLLPVAAVMGLKRVNWVLLVFFLFCWTPAVLLVKSAFSTRRPKFSPARRLSGSEAPALFAMVQELAKE